MIYLHIKELDDSLLKMQLIRENGVNVQVLINFKCLRIAFSDV